MSLYEEIRATVTSLLQRIGIDRDAVLVGVVFSVVSFFGTIALTGAVLIRLPADYLTSEDPKHLRRKDLRARFERVVRHLLGVVLILVGLILMLPGVPGQGLLTVIAGLFISELPGTNRLLRRLLRSPRVFAAVNKLRARYKHPPLDPAEQDATRGNSGDEGHPRSNA